MSVNSSSSFNSSLPPSGSSNTFDIMSSCLTTQFGAFSLFAFIIICLLLLLPLCVAVLYLGLQRWRNNKPASHSDVFTFHMVAVELISISGWIVACCGIYTGTTTVTTLGLFFTTMNVTAQNLFHIISCVERYLAVVHPVAYLDLRTAKGLRVRNLTIGCVWLLCVAFTVIGFARNNKIFVSSYFFVSIFNLLVIFFCSISVLRVLVRPGPGDGGGGRRKVDRSKLKAFYTIMAILGVLVLRFGANLVTVFVYDTAELGHDESCSLWISIVWFCFPSSLLLPLLFIQRAGKLRCCQTSNKSGQRSS